MPSSRPLLLALASALSATAAAASPRVGQPAPAFQAKDADGRTRSLAEFRGRTVVLEWTNRGCPFVRHAYKSGVMPELQHEAEREGVVWLTVISSAPGRQGYLQPAEVSAWKAEVGAAPTDVLLDPGGAVGRLYQAKTTPHMFIVDPKGRLAYMGGFDDKVSTNPADAKTAHNYVRAALEDLRADRPVRDAVTRPYGCSIKY